MKGRTLQLPISNRCCKTMLFRGERLSKTGIWFTWSGIYADQPPRGRHSMAALLRCNWYPSLL